MSSLLIFPSMLCFYHTCILTLIKFYFWYRVIYHRLILNSLPSREDLEILTLLPPLVKFEDYRYTPACPVYVVREFKSKGLCILNKFLTTELHWQPVSELLFGLLFFNLCAYACAHTCTFKLVSEGAHVPHTSRSQRTTSGAGLCFHLACDRVSSCLLLRTPG